LAPVPSTPCHFDGRIAAPPPRDADVWESTVRRFDGLVRSAARRYGLGAADVDDVVQITWLRLFRSIDRVREPTALPGWLFTTASRESLRLRQRGMRELPLDDATLADEPRGEDHEALALVLRTERREAVRLAASSLAPRARELLDLLSADAEPSYAEIARALDIPVGSIGPTRGRLIERLAREPAVLAIA
jgi:RNA polymerase sigma factor (sigma-70 family)